MSPYLPPEIMDLVVDNLSGEPHTLGICCLVSKDWVYRTRRHLFNRVAFGRSRHVSQWRETFRDPLNSPAHHTRILSIELTSLIPGADMVTLLTFCSVTHLSVDTTYHYDQTLSLVPLHGFSPAIRSLNLTLTTLPSSEIFDFVCSLPLLEDLSFTGRPRKWDETWKVPSTSPRLCGSLKLHRVGGIQSIISRLLDFPAGLHFRKVSVEWSFPEDVGSTMDLASRCSDTLESLEITGYLADTTETVPLDLFNIPNLKDVEFTCNSPNVRWVTEALLTADTENLQNVTLVLSHRIVLRVVLLEEVFQGWPDLDNLLVRFSTSNSLRPKVAFQSRGGWEGCVARLLPESTRQGILDLDESGTRS